MNLPITHLSRSFHLRVHVGTSYRGPDCGSVGLRSEEYRVILHRDPLHEVSSVVAMLTEVIAALEEPDATRIARQAFSSGQAVVIACAKAQAECYYHQLTNQYQLVVTLEAA